MKTENPKIRIQSDQIGSDFVPIFISTLFLFVFVCVFFFYLFNYSNKIPEIGGHHKCYSMKIKKMLS